MRNAAIYWMIVLPVFLWGCQSPPAPVAGEGTLCTGFVPSSVHVAGLTQLIGAGAAEEPQTLRVFIELRDLYDTKLKAPFTLRIELYQYVPHSSNPRGKHLQTWPDFILLDLNTNHLYWRDYLRAYEFALEVIPPVSTAEPLLLEITCRTGESKRIGAFYILNPK